MIGSTNLAWIVSNTRKWILSLIQSHKTNLQYEIIYYNLVISLIDVGSPLE